MPKKKVGQRLADGSMLDLGYTLNDDEISQIKEISNKVPKTRKINNKELSEDITLTAEDVGALPKDTQVSNDAVFVVDTYTQYTLWGNNDLQNGIYILKAGGIVYYGHGANSTSSTYAHSCGAGSVLIYSRNVDFVGSSGSAYFKLFMQSKSVAVGATTYSSSTSRSIAFADGTSQLNKILQVTTATNQNSNVKTEATWETQTNVNNGTLTLQQNGTTLGTFSANQSNNVTYNITTPTDYVKSSDLGTQATYTLSGTHLTITIKE